MQRALVAYLVNVFTAASQTVNALAAGAPDESLSSRAHRLQHRAGWRVVRRVVNAVFWWQADHCLEAWQSERARRQLPPELR